MLEDKSGCLWVASPCYRGVQLAAEIVAKLPMALFHLGTCLANSLVLLLDSVWYLHMVQQSLVNLPQTQDVLWGITVPQSEGILNGFRSVCENGIAKALY